MKHRRIWCGLLAALCLLSGCGGPAGPSASAGPPAASVRPGNSAPAGETGEPPEDGVSYQAPPMADARFHDADEVDGIRLDLSATEQGYVAVSAVSGQPMKMKALKGEEEYTYNIASDGTPSIFPLQCGNGLYTFQVWENIEGTKYARIFTADAEVSLSDEFQPFIRPSDYVNYSAGSEAVKKAAGLARGCRTALDVVSAVYDCICSGVTYDYEKAASVPKGYLPDPDETLRTGKGICFDYASLAAAMLRSQGIPTKVIFGYVSPDDVYHAWNMFYTEDTGWVTVDYKVSASQWNRLDLTFSANGTDGAFIGDGGNYADVYLY